VEVITGCVEGYKLAYPESNFELDTPNYTIHVDGVPEYIAQLLDKLVANAVEFSYPDQPITVYCRALRDHAVIKVSNAGPFLPEEMKDRLFDSMISGAPAGKTAPAAFGDGLTYRASDFRLPWWTDSRGEQTRPRGRYCHGRHSPVL
jgi:signal transduction histidine kinase